MNKPIRVAIVDDSAVVRQVFSSLLETVSELELAFTANDPVFALKRMKESHVDVFILDVEMPRMDGITFLKKLMLENPKPVIVCSTLTDKGTEEALNALACGATDVITKPKIGLKGFLESEKELFVSAILRAASIKVSKAQVDKLTCISSSNHCKNIINIPDIKVKPKILKTTEKIIAIGSSTGGTIAIEKILQHLDNSCFGIVIAQHMPEKFTDAFASRLNSLFTLNIKEAKGGEIIRKGCVFIAPGDRHLTVERNGAFYITKLLDIPPVNRHKPSVDVLFDSVAKYAGPNALGIILTGMGSDGAKGLRNMLDSGAETITQNEVSCAVFGMPAAAIKLNAAKQVLHLAKIPSAIKKFVYDNTSKS